MNRKKQKLSNLERNNASIQWKIKVITSQNKKHPTVGNIRKEYKLKINKK